MTTTHRIHFFCAAIISCVGPGCTPEQEREPVIQITAPSSDMKMPEQDMYDVPDTLDSGMFDHDLDMASPQGIVCEADHHVDRGACRACPKGSTNEAGDDPAGGDTLCESLKCLIDEFVQDHACKSCAVGTTNAAGDNASGADTSCKPVTCPSRKRVENNQCVACPPGTTNASGDDASGADTQCDDTKCLANHYVRANACVRCPRDATNEAGDLASGPDTSCDDRCVLAFGKPCPELYTDYIKDPSPIQEAYFGMRTSISGNTLAVAVPRDARANTQDLMDDSAPQSGGVHIFVRGPATTSWTHQAFLKAPYPEAEDFFGSSLSLSGDTLVVGAPGESSELRDDPTNNAAPQSGAAFVFVRDPATQTWSQQAYLKASNLDAEDRFGVSVALEGDLLAISALGEDSGDASDPLDNSMPDSGAVYIFTRDPNTQTWVEQDYLKATNLDADDLFGVVLSLSQNTLAVSAPYEDSAQADDPLDNMLFDSGAVYVFARDPVNLSWSQEAYIKAPNRGIVDYFGDAISISGDTLVVGIPSEDSPNASQPYSDALRGSGGVYVFHRDDTTRTWSEQAFLKASNAAYSDEFGWSVSVFEDMIAVGARREDSASVDAPGDDSAENSGAVYVFTRDPNSNDWVERTYLKAPYVDAGDTFGYFLSLSERTLAVGCIREDGGPAHDPSENVVYSSGAVFMYEF